MSEFRNTIVSVAHITATLDHCLTGVNSEALAEEIAASPFDFDRMVEAIARNHCNSLVGESSGSPHGHCFGYEECVAPNCSCWEGRKHFVINDLIALLSMDLTEKSDGC